MVKYGATAFLVAAGALASASTAGGALAAQCPSGQIFRVSLNKCAPRAENLQYLKGGNGHKAVHVAAPSKAHEPADVALRSSLKPVEAAPETPAETTVAPRAEPVEAARTPAAIPTDATAYAQYSAPSPFGGLPQWSPQH